MFKLLVFIAVVFVAAVVVVVVAVIVVVVVVVFFFAVVVVYFIYYFNRYDKRDDFTVVLQPFFDHTIIPRKPDGSVDRSFFAPDCFHFSGKAHAASALALWNAMLEPVGKKVRT